MLCGMKHDQFELPLTDKSRLVYSVVSSYQITMVYEVQIHDRTVIQSWDKAHYT
jgi:hypothetical protein